MRKYLCPRPVMRCSETHLANGGDSMPATSACHAEPVNGTHGKSHTPRTPARPEIRDSTAVLCWAGETYDTYVTHLSPGHHLCRTHLTRLTHTCDTPGADTVPPKSREPDLRPTPNVGTLRATLRHYCSVHQPCIRLSTGIEPIVRSGVVSGRSATSQITSPFSRSSSCPAKHHDGCPNHHRCCTIPLVAD